MKDIRDIKKEYGYTLRWSNGGGDESGQTWGYTFWLEDVETGDKRIIDEPEALEYISKMTTKAFRRGRVYEAYEGLFEVLEIERRS